LLAKTATAAALAAITTTIACSGLDDRPTRAQALSCPTTPAPDLLDLSLCICEDLDDVGTLEVGSIDPAVPAAVGVNGSARFVNDAVIDGALNVFGGIDGVGELDVSGDLLTASNASFVGAASAGGDMEVGGDLSAVGGLGVGGALRVGGETSILGASQIGSEEPLAATPNAPCGCDAAGFFDVRAAVAAAAAANDNAAAGLPTEINSLGDSELILGSGSYYVTDLDSVGSMRIVADGTVAIYVDGDLRSVGAERFELTPGSTLDLYVAGAVATVGNVAFGAEADPGAFRLYVGGDDAAHLAVGAQRFFGAIYAPEAALAYVGDTEITGAVFARDLDGVGAIKIGYAAPSAGECEEPPGDGDDDDGGATPPVE
jgi:hypothetical protein